MEQSVMLTFDEVRILLYSLGFTKCEGIYMPEKEFSAEAILRTMHKLSSRGILNVHTSGEKPQFVIKPALRRMLVTMGAPAGTFIFRPGEGIPGFSAELNNGPEYFCYMVPDYCLVAERDWTRKDSLRLRAMKPDEFQDWQKERELEAQELMAGVSEEYEKQSFETDETENEKTGTDQVLMPIL